MEPSFIEESREDVSYAGVKRVKAILLIPSGKTEDEIEAILGRTARTIGREENARATSILAYRPEDDLTGPYTIGCATYAPNGQWEEAHSTAPMAVTIQIGTTYFRTEADLLAFHPGT